MKIYLKSSLLIVCLSFWWSTSKAQDPAFSQFYAAGLFLNPAMAGQETNYFFGVNQRTNIYKQLFPYNLSQFSFIYPIKHNKFKTLKRRDGHVGGIGLTSYRETCGPNDELRTFGIMLSTSYFVQVSRAHYISFGLQGGYLQKRINFDKLTWGSQWDEYIGYNAAIPVQFNNFDERKGFPDFSSGMIWYYKPNSQGGALRSRIDGFAGIAATNLNRPNESFFEDRPSELPILYKFHGGMSYQINQRTAIMPNVLVLRQHEMNQFNFGCYVSYKVSEDLAPFGLEWFNAQLGVWHRYGDSFILSLGCRVKSFQFAISYDFNTSTFKYYSRGSGATEISLAYRIFKGISSVKNFSNPLM